MAITPNRLEDNDNDTSFQGQNTKTTGSIFRSPKVTPLITDSQDVTSLKARNCSPTNNRPPTPKYKSGVSIQTTTTWVTSPYIRRTFTEDFVQLLVECHGLPKCDLFSKTDPLCVLLVKRYGQWIEYGRTETIMNCHDPKFVETFKIDRNRPENEMIKFALYDSKNMHTKDLNRCQYIGSCVTDIRSLVEDEQTENELQSEENSSVGKICVWAIKLKGELNDKKQIHVTIGASKLVKKGLFNRIDAFFEISREVKESFFHPIYRSEMIIKNNNPRWRTLPLTLEQLCNGNLNSPFLITIYNYNPKGDHELLGRIEMNTNELLNVSGTVKKIPMKKLSSNQRTITSKKTDKKKYDSSAAAVHIYQVKMNAVYSLTDYIKGGVHLNCSIAVDFTLSNGDPFDQSSLHFLDENSKNEYVKVLQQVGAWMAHYTKNIQFYGFGAIFDEYEEGDSVNEKTKDEENVNYCFKINSFTQHQNSIEEVVQSYKNILPKVKPSGPTYFKNILKHMLSDSDYGENMFSLALLITDGIPNDEEKLKKYLLSIADKAVLIVMIGVGPCNFNATKDLVHFINKKTERKLVLFLSLLKHSHASADIKELYVNISKTIVNYFTSRNFQPKVSDISESDYMQNESEMESDANRNYHLCCPTCGSQANLPRL